MCVHSLHPHSKLQKQNNFSYEYYYVAVIDTCFVCSNEEDKTFGMFCFIFQ